ncbi:MAG: DUF2309 domain-containing protein [Magnetococcales bacterium]|nr:DUF2309 domain-containing protein [Magnetococcales bacterium]
MAHEDDVSATPPTRKERIHAALHHLEHLVPGQASITDFVHHNTLHGFQHLPFPQALIEAKRWTGIHGYLPAERFRALYASGRIRRVDLEAVIGSDPELRAAEPLGPTRRGEVILLKLIHGIDSIPARQLAWEIEERGALERCQPGMDAAVRAAFAVPDEAAAVGGLWRVCLERFALSHHDWYREERLDLASEEELLFSGDGEPGEDPEAQRQVIEAIRAEAERSWEALSGRVGEDLTLRGLLLAVTGEDVLASIRPYLVRFLASFLDLGVAPWPLPLREAGFYTAWKRCAEGEMVQALEELPDWLDHLAELPEQAMEAIEFCLLRLGLPEERWQGYLERLALELPGWSGMVTWRGARPGYGGSEARVALVDYLAVRLVLERLFAVRLCRAQWLLEPTLQSLGRYFQRFRGEFYARRVLFTGELPEFLATRATRLVQRPPEESGLAKEWRKLAFLIWTQTGGGSAGQGGGASGKVWPLFVLAQHLGAGADTVRNWDEATVESLLSCMASLDEDTAGFIWLRAYERHYREGIFAALVANHGRGRWASRPTRPAAQVIFCMDDREEGIRRHLEEADPEIETLGAAGFFGVPVRWLGLDDTAPADLCPVVVVPAHEVHEQPAPGAEERVRRHRLWRGWRERWNRLFIRESHRGLILPALLPVVLAPWVWLMLLARGWFPGQLGGVLERLVVGIDPGVPTTVTLNAPENAPPATSGRPRIGFTRAEQMGRVAGFLRTIGLTDGFAPVVAILGHGGHSQNNPHLAAYDCGACSGRHGGPNARLFAAMANDPQVRQQLGEQGIHIPADTWFVGGEHDTGCERIDWYDQDVWPPGHHPVMQRLIVRLDAARLGSAHERARRLASAPHGPSARRALAHMGRRGRDYSQARPELGHATNAVALIGRRSVTRGVFFDRRMFLISYDPTRDPDGTIVESILLAAGPVGAGISLEYYFSSVDNERFGCGTKVAHNLTGLFGVMDGTASDLRTGLPRQMIEIHEAMRLLVVVEQRPEVLTGIYQRQEPIRELVGLGWIELACIDPDTGAIHHFSPREGWRPWEPVGDPVPVTPRSAAWYAGCSDPLPPALIGDNQTANKGERSCPGVTGGSC